MENFGLKDQWYLSKISHEIWNFTWLSLQHIIFATGNLLERHGTIYMDLYRKKITGKLAE